MIYSLPFAKMTLSTPYSRLPKVGIFSFGTSPHLIKVGQSMGISKTLQNSRLSRGAANLSQDLNGTNVMSHYQILYPIPGVPHRPSRAPPQRSLDRLARIQELHWTKGRLTNHFAIRVIAMLPSHLMPYLE
jgi:hypothetical protein